MLNTAQELLTHGVRSRRHKVNSSYDKGPGMQRTSRLVIANTNTALLSGKNADRLLVAM
jgi:hypothetical protein